MSKQTYIMAHDLARRRAVAAVVEAPAGYVITIAPPGRTTDQNSLIHPTISSIAQALGRPTDKESLRQLRYLLLEQWMHETNRPPMFQRSFDGQRWVSVNKGTSDLDKPDCSEFIEFLLATEADVSTQPQNAAA
jgi:NinB protein